MERQLVEVTLAEEHNLFLLGARVSRETLKYP
jgi:hypothetical protein